MSIAIRTMQGQIADYLRRDILSGNLQPGQALREQEISGRFGVSRGPVREVFRQLTQQGLLVAEPNKGVRVAQRPTAEMRPLIVDLRQRIELYVLDLVFEKLGNEALAELETALADIKSACQQNAKVALVEHDLRFHQTIIQSYEDDDYFTLWQPIALRMSIRYTRFGDNLMNSYYEHERIFVAIRDGDKAEAKKALKANIQ